MRNPFQGIKNARKTIDFQCIQINKLKLALQHAEKELDTEKTKNRKDNESWRSVINEQKMQMRLFQDENFKLRSIILAVSEQKIELIMKEKRNAEARAAKAKTKKKNK